MTKNETILKVYWSKKEKDFMVQYPRKCDGHFIQNKLFIQNMIFDLIKYNKTTCELPYKMEADFIKELEERGYDKTTMKFEIKLKQPLKQTT